MNDRHVPDASKRVTATPDVVVIGGGFAGVTAARDLTQAGRSVLLLEGRHRLGGRTWYRTFNGRDQKLELGGTWVSLEDQRYVARELERYGIGTFQSPVATRFGWGLCDEIVHKPFPIPVEQWGDLERAITHINSQASRLRFYDEPLGQEGLDDLDISFEAFVDHLELPRATREFILAWPSFYFGAYPDKLSALHVLSWVTGFGNSAVGWYTKLTDKITNGTINLLEHIIGDSTAEVRLNTPVAAIAQHGDVVCVTTRDGAVIETKAVVLATPINTWSSLDVFPPLQGSHLAMAQEKQAGESVKIWALVRGLDENFFGVGWHTAIKWLASEYTTEDGTYLCGFASAAADLNPNDKSDIVRAVHELLPDVDVVDVDAHDWNADEFSQGTWMAYRPGQVMAHSRNLQQPQGRLVFANSDLASGWAGWIDGAIESGTRAASIVCGGLKR